MKISTVLPIVGLMIFPVTGLAQTSEIQATSIQSATTVAATSTSIKCGVNSFTVSNECGIGVYKNVYVQCYGGYETNLGASESSCKSTDLWNQYAKEACANHCPNGGWSGTVSTDVPTPIIYAKETTEGGNRYTPLGPSSVPIVAQEWVSVCTTIDRLIQNYNETVLELQKQEALSNKGKIESLTKTLENQKIYIEAVNKACMDPQTAWQVGAPPKEIENKPVAESASIGVMIKENVLRVSGVGVKMSASEVTKKLGITPTTIELKEENSKAVYSMKIYERRKLFGFIPFNSQKTITADAENGDTLSERLPWYNFLTTK